MTRRIRADWSPDDGDDAGVLLSRRAANLRAAAVAGVDQQASTVAPDTGLKLSIE